MSYRLEWKPKKLQRPISHLWRNMPQQSQSLNRRWQKRRRYSHVVPETHDGCLSLGCSTLFCSSGWCVCWRVCSTFVPCIISRSCFFLCNGITVETPDWIHLTDWLDQLQIEIRSVEFGLHILPHHSSSTTKSGSSDPLLSLEKAVRQPHFPRRSSQVILKTQHMWTRVLNSQHMCCLTSPSPLHVCSLLWLRQNLQF